MKRIILSSTFLFACLLGACSSDSDVVCDLVWTGQDQSEVGEVQLVYEGLDDAQTGVDMCKDDEPTRAEKPAEAVAFTCNCSTR